MQGQVGELRKELARLLERDDADERVAEEAERPARARAGRSRSWCTTTIDEIAQAQGDAAHHTGDTSNESGSKKGDTVVEIGGGARRAARHDRLRGQEQAAVEERRLDRAQLAAWASATPASPSSWSPARTRSRPGSRS